MSVFDEKALEWDTPERVEQAREVASAIRARVPLTGTTRVIDIGAGTGLLGLGLAADVGSVVLAEPSEGMIAMARAKIAGGPIGNASAIVYDVPGDPPDGAPFDLAVSLLMLHHVEDTPGVLRSVHALLAPGGCLALADLDAEDGTFHEHGREDIAHHGFDQASLVELATAEGFREARTEVIGAVDREGRSYPLFLLTARRD